MPSKKTFIADNQQERQRLIGWIVGFVDGEGCFSVSMFKNHTTKSGWQVFPELVITQGEKSKKALEEFKKFFQCGKIYVNRRHDNHRENLYRFCVRKLTDLDEKIIPFFQEHQLKTAKKDDFRKFSQIVKMMCLKKHLIPTKQIEIAKLIEKMNQKKSAIFLSSSETTRQTR